MKKVYQVGGWVDVTSTCLYDTQSLITLHTVPLYWMSWICFSIDPLLGVCYMYLKDFEKVSTDTIIILSNSTH